ncbi:uncharacterized protein LOC115877900 [Sitophilus oryzae]|uniref:Uncharacterized protein LOC115877900 n=1 Tax=Sitophilus oryzae TaxID=7048 RepID=A0A6J2XFJ5_SITOR|nr:uncharacterized protein LOC115877900 [Sitophilus oryzae]
MRLLSINNDQNIGRALPKMTDNFQHESNTKLPDCLDSYLNHSPTDNSTFNNIGAQSNIHVLNGTNCFNCPENGEVSSSDTNCQTAESEVKSLKEWLILHNDLIQQQNDEILEREHQIYLLQKENEMLKDRLNCIEKGIPYDPDRHFDTGTENTIRESFPEDMTQDLCGQYDDDTKENVELVNPQQSDNVVTCSLEVTNYESNRVSDVESQVDTTIDEDNFTLEENEFKSEDYIANELSNTAECNKDYLSEYNFTVNNFGESDSMKNIKMSIRRKRVSSSSVLSNTEPVLMGEKKTFKRMKKKRRRLTKDSQILTSKEPYIICTNEEDLNLSIEPEIEDLMSSPALEVPRWRVKHYTSCYTMEGTENLDDEVYNKRHMRLEIDERRRKRWDVQRIREQRVIEKLKQRQERVGSGSKGENDSDSPTSLWPNLEDIKYLEVNDELPVSAFGHPVPKVNYNNFQLPWLQDPSVLSRRNNAKRSTIGRRKRSKIRR